MHRRIAILSLLFAWLCANGILLDAMQLVAWGKMFAGYSQSMSVGQALKETFDPAKPCEMCSRIAKVKDEVKEKMPLPEQQHGGKFVLAIHTVDSPVFRNDPGEWMNSPATRLTERTDPVPLPPPRV